MARTIAYAVLAHHQPEMLRRLASELSGRPIVVHVDAAADAEPFEQIPGLRLVKDRVKVNWGGFSMVEATLRLYRDCLIELGGERDAAVALLSGNDFPVRPVDEFERFVRSAPWSEHIRAVPLVDGDRVQENRIRRRWLFDAVPAGRRGWRRQRNAAIRRTLAAALPRRSLSTYGSWTPAVSSQWTLLSRACLEELLPIALRPDYQRLFRRTFAPDETFFATLVHSTAWASRTQFGSLEARGDRLTTEFPNFHFIDPSVAVWLDAGYARAVHESEAFFARKFRIGDLDRFLDALAEVRGAEAGSGPRSSVPRRQ